MNTPSDYFAGAVLAVVIGFLGLKGAERYGEHVKREDRLFCESVAQAYSRAHPERGAAEAWFLLGKCMHVKGYAEHQKDNR